MEVRYKRREKVKHYLTVKENENRLHAIFFRKGNRMKIQIDWFPPLFENKEMKSLPFVKEIVKEAKKIGEKWKTHFFHIDFKHIPNRLKDYENIIQYFDENWIQADKKIQFLEHFLEKNMTDMKKEDFFFFHEQSITKKMIDYIEIFEQVIKEKEKNDPTITIIDKMFSSVSASYGVYFQGVRYVFILSLSDQNKLLFKKGKEIEEIDSEHFSVKKWEEKWSKEFDTLYNNQRIKTIFNPPEYHQRKNKVRLSGDFHIQNKIMEDLKTKYSQKELEVLFARSDKESKIDFYCFNMEESKICLSYIEENYYVYNQNDRKREFFAFQDKELAKIAYEKLIRLKCEEKIEKQRKMMDRFL